MEARTKPKKIDILHLHDDFIVVNKPSGLLSAPDRYQDDAEHVCAMLRPRYGEAWLVHRLDKDTSGVMVIARSADAHRELQSAFSERMVEKEYLAIVHGHLPTLSGQVNAPIAPHLSRPGKMHIQPKGKPSTTDWQAVASFGSYHLLSLRPRTGRTHQLRVHLADIHLPIVADPFYSPHGPLMLSNIKRKYNERTGRQERPLLDRTALHARSLSFELGNEPYNFEVAPPKDIRASLNQLEKVFGVIQHEPANTSKP